MVSCDSYDVWCVHGLRIADEPVTTAESTSSQTTFSTRVSTTSTASTIGFEAASATIDSVASTSTAVPAEGGIPTVATIGLIAGAAAILLVIGAFAAFFYRRKAQKKIAAAYGKTEDEKHGHGHGISYDEKVDDVPTPTSSERAPRISLRPVTQFLPNLMTTAPAAAVATTATTTSLSPFAPAPTPAPAPAPQQMATSPTGLSASETRKAPPPALTLISTKDASSAPSTGGFTTAPLVAPAFPSPTGSNFTDAPNTPIVIPGTAVLNNPVHRVQMDFKPSMGDELELRAGALVRLLHEYDDGWALCIRLDRSQQGVCPRTCLSQRPVKPRPTGPPGSPPQARPRPQSPSVQIRAYSPVGPRSQSPQQYRPHSPAMSRPQSPAMMRPQSPGMGYVKPQYRPAGDNKVESVPSTPTMTSAPSSPISRASPPPSLRAGPPQITVSEAPESRPQSPVAAQFAPVKPSPLHNEQRVSVVVVEEVQQQQQTAFHAM